MDSKRLRRLYNHRSWSSPRARVCCQILKLDLNVERELDSIGRKKKLTHEVALNLLAKRCNLPLEEFLDLETKEAWIRLGCYRDTPYGKQIYDPLYPYKNYYY